MPFQIVLQTYKQNRGLINSFTAGPDQLVLCENIINLEATVDGNLFGHTIEWEQIAGNPVTLLNPNTLTPSYVEVDTTEKTFRFYIDRGTVFEQFDDITVFSKPVSNTTYQQGKTKFRKFLEVDEVECSSIQASFTTTAPPPITFSGNGPDTLSNLVIDWDLPPDLVKRPYLEELNLQIGGYQIPDPTIMYTMDEVIDTETIIDERGNFNAPNNGNGTFVAGKEGNAIDFSGVSADYLNLTGALGPAIGDFALSFWLELDASGTRTILTLNSTPGTRATLSLNGSQLLYQFYISNAQPGRIEPPVGVVGNGYHHIVFMRTGSTIGLYVDNVSYTSPDTDISNASVFPMVEFLLGALTTSNPFPTNGRYDALRVYDRGLTPAEINQLFIEFDGGGFSEPVGPINHYTFNNVVSNVIFDNQDNIDSTFLGTFTAAPGIDGNAFSFDGTTNRMLLAEPFDTNPTAFSVSCWSQKPPSGVSKSDNFFSHRETSGGSYIVFSEYQSKLIIYLKDDIGTVTQIETASTFDLSTQLNHIVFIFRTDGNCEIWLNGVQEISQPYSSLNGHTSNLQEIGGFSFPGVSIPVRMQGELDQYRLYNHALSSSEVAALYNEFETVSPITSDSFTTVASYEQTDTQEFTAATPYPSAVVTAGPLSYWRFEEASGSTLNDTINGTNNGNIINSPTLGSPPLIYTGNSITFNGTTHNVQTSNPYDHVQQSGVFSLIGWIKLNNYSADKQNVICGTNLGTNVTNNGFAFYYENRISEGSPNSLRFLFSVGSVDTILLSANGVITDSQPHFVAVTGDGANLYMYVDGIEVAQTPIVSLSVGSSCHSFDISNAYDCDISNYRPASGFEGRLDELAIFDKTLDTAQILELFYSGKYDVLNFYRVETNFNIADNEFTTYSCVVDFSTLEIPNTCVTDDTYTGYSQGSSKSSVVRFTNNNISEIDDFSYQQSTPIISRVNFDNISIEEIDNSSYQQNTPLINITRFAPTST